MRIYIWLLCLFMCFSFLNVLPAFAAPTLSTNNTPSASNLPLDGEGSATTHIVKVSTLSLSTDNIKGFTVTISSGSLAKTSQETPIAYRVVTVPAGDNPPSSADFTVVAGNSYTFVTNQAGSQNRDLYIFYTPAALQDPGNYSATIAIAIVDNP